MPLAEFDHLDLEELADVFAGYHWRLRRDPIILAYRIAQFTTGTKDLPSLEELLGEKEAMSLDDVRRRIRDVRDRRG